MQYRVITVKKNHMLSRSACDMISWLHTVTALKMEPYTERLSYYASLDLAWLALTLLRNVVMFNRKHGKCYQGMLGIAWLILDMIKRTRLID